jgi:hypothetical protein
MEDTKYRVFVNSGSYRVEKDNLTDQEAYGLIREIAEDNPGDQMIQRAYNKNFKSGITLCRVHAGTFRFEVTAEEV